MPLPTRTPYATLTPRRRPPRGRVFVTGRRTLPEATPTPDSGHDGGAGVYERQWYRVITP